MTGAATAEDVTELIWVYPDADPPERTVETLSTGWTSSPSSQDPWEDRIQYIIDRGQRHGVFPGGPVRFVIHLGPAEIDADINKSLAIGIEDMLKAFQEMPLTHSIGRRRRRGKLDRRADPRGFWGTGAVGAPDQWTEWAQFKMCEVRHVAHTDFVRSEEARFEAERQARAWGPIASKVKAAESLIAYMRKWDLLTSDEIPIVLRPVADESLAVTLERAIHELYDEVRVGSPGWLAEQDEKERARNAARAEQDLASSTEAIAPILLRSTR